MPLSASCKAGCTRVVETTENTENTEELNGPFLLLCVLCALCVLCVLCALCVLCVLSGSGQLGAAADGGDRAALGHVRLARRQRAFHAPDDLVGIGDQISARRH